MVKKWFFLITHFEFAISILLKNQYLSSFQRFCATLKNNLVAEKARILVAEWYHFWQITFFTFVCQHSRQSKQILGPLIIFLIKSLSANQKRQIRGKYCHIIQAAADSNKKGPAIVFMVLWFKIRIPGPE